MLTAEQACEWGKRTHVRELILRCSHPEGLVNYVAADGQSALDRSLELASEISLNGTEYSLQSQDKFVLTRHSSPGAALSETGNITRR